MKTPEQQGIRISLVGALFFAILGIGFAIWSESQAVLLDGAFNLITAIMVLFAMRITRLLGEPESAKRPAGYVALEPLYILSKGLILLILTLFVMVSNIIIMMRGGNELKLGAITIYIGVAVLGNFLVWFLINQKLKKSGSPLLEVEKENWLVNALISSGIGVAFLLVFIFQDSAIKPFVPYVDQVVVILVGIVSISVPLKAIRTGLRELLLMGTDESIHDRASGVIEAGIDKSEVQSWKLYMLKTGRKYWFTLFTIPGKDSLDSGFSDRLRDNLTEKLQKEFEEFKDCNLDIILTRE